MLQRNLSPPQGLLCIVNIPEQPSLLSPLVLSPAKLTGMCWWRGEFKYIASSPMTAKKPTEEFCGAHFPWHNFYLSMHTISARLLLSLLVSQYKPESKNLEQRLSCILSWGVSVFAIIPTPLPHHFGDKGILQQHWLMINKEVWKKYLVCMWHYSIVTHSIYWVDLGAEHHFDETLCKS